MLFRSVSQSRYNPPRRTEYDPYVKYTTVTKEKSGYSYDFFRYVDFMLDGIKTFVGADGTYLAEFNLYAIEDYGYLEDKGCCDPFVTTPNDYGLAITGGWRRVIKATTPAVPADSPLWAAGDWLAWEEIDLAAIEEYVLWKPAPRCTTYCPGANFDTLELQLCDTINIPNCETTYTVNGPENYFTVEVVDVDYGRYNTGTDFAPSTTGSIYPTPSAQKTTVAPASLLEADFATLPPYVGQAISDALS